MDYIYYRIMNISTNFYAMSFPLNIGARNDSESLSPSKKKRITQVHESPQRPVKSCSPAVRKFSGCIT